MEFQIAEITGCLKLTWDFIRADNGGEKALPKCALQIHSVETLSKVSRLKQTMCRRLICRKSGILPLGAVAEAAAGEHGGCRESGAEPLPGGTGRNRNLCRGPGPQVNSTCKIPKQN